MYSPLKSDERQIRLVTIKAGRWWSSLRCHLTCVSLNDAPHYEALSYVWGNPDDRVQVLLNEQSVGVTRNLGQALSYLRSPSEDRVIWIDALCINQEDLDERASQVRLMPDIYRMAWRVVSWLGAKDARGYATVAAWIVSEAARNHFSPSWVQNWLLDEDKLLNHPQSVLGTAKHIYKRACIRRLGNFLKVQNWEYWRRIWIVQEIAFAKDGILQCGGTIIQFQDLNRLCEVVEEWLAPGNDFYVKAMAASGVDYMNALIDDLLPLRHCQITTITPPNVPLFALLLRYQHNLASDPRDKVYGLLALSDMVSSAHLGVQIDYHRSVRDVYMGTVQAIVETTSSLDILCASFPQVGKYQYSVPPAADLPTWTPDWSSLAEAPNILTLTAGSVGAAGDSRPTAEFKLDEGLLKVTGFCVGTISCCGTASSIPSNPQNNSLDFYLGVYDTVCSWHRIFSRIPRYERDLDKLFLQTIAMGNSGDDDAFSDLHMDEIPRPSPEYELGKTAIKDVSELMDKKLLGSLLLKDISNLCADRAFFSAQNIRPSSLTNQMDTSVLVGISCPGTRVGDLVCVLMGCFLPVILRPLGENRHAFLGAAYVHNLMNGVALKGLQNGDYTQHSFQIV
ncbi:heterokaryon incompatibility protein-domain-containing protein [Nemania abortiva]|nr:heterokaryon incompatibility protein-domain-containing protein [Nemania abortiva]